MVWLNINKKYFDENKEKFNKEAISEYGEEEGRENYLINIDIDTTTIEEINENIITVCNKNEFGIIYIDIKLEEDDIIDLIKVITKKMNKIKAFLETLK